jgi:hypothetical protein
MWEALAPFMDPRTGGASGIEGASVSIIGSTMYVSHGYRPGDSPLLSSYDIPTDTWTHGGPGLPDAMVPRSEGAGGMVAGLHFSIGGRPGTPGPPGDSVEMFTPGGGWTTMSPMPTARRGLGAASVGGLIYAAGGDPGSAPGGPADPSGPFEVFDPFLGVGGTWTALAPLPFPVTDAEATIGLGPAESGTLAGAVYVFGGRDMFGSQLSVTQIYDIASGTWSIGSSMPTARSNAMAGLIDVGAAEDGMIAVYGGFVDSLGNVPITELYDPLTDTWVPGPPMLFPQSEHAVGLAWDSTGIYAVGSGIFGAAGPVVERLVPEPASLTLLLFGALPLFRRR